MSEVNPVNGYADSYRSMARQGVQTVQVWSVIADLERNIAPHYDALAAQRDEGLAREELMRLGYEQCKQRLAEAENLLRSLDQSWNYHNGRAGHSETMVKVEKFLVAPGCADGEPTK